jgi:hypothetical protein
MSKGKSVTEIEERLVAIERLTRLFRFERFTYLIICVLALFALFYMVGVEIIRGKGDGSWQQALTLLGPGGLISYSGARVLHVWTQALRLIAGQPIEGPK